MDSIRSDISQRLGMKLLAYVITASFGLLLAESIESVFEPSYGIELTVNHSNDNESGQENEESKESNKLDDCEHHPYDDQAILTDGMNKYFSLIMCPNAGMQDVATPPPEMG